MGGGSDASVPPTEGGSNLGPYAQQMIRAGMNPSAPRTSPAQFLMPAQADMSYSPNFAEAQANALRAINALPVNVGRYAISPTLDPLKSTNAPADSQYTNSQHPLLDAIIRSGHPFNRYLYPSSYNNLPQ